MSDTKQYREGYWDGVNGRHVPWSHLLDAEYHRGYMAGHNFKIKPKRKSFWDIFA